MSQNLQEPINPNANLHDDGGNGGISGGELLCTNCNTVNPTKARFCTNCGWPLMPIEQMSTMQFREGSSFSLYDAPMMLNAEASTATLRPSPGTEEASPITNKQEAMSSVPLASSPDTGEAIPIIRNRFGSNNNDGWRRRIRSRRTITIALISLILLLIVSSLPFIVPYLLAILPASAATVTITPASHHLAQTYTIQAVTGTPDASQHQVGARFISYTTPKKSLTAKATGQGSEGVTEATGTLVFSNATGSFVIFAQTFGDASGIGLTIDSSLTIFPGQTVSVFAHAAQAGSTGNVPANDINGTFNVGQSGTQIGTVYIQNPNPFSGGQDQSYSIVQQSDIDGAVGSLQDQLTSVAQMGIQKQLHMDEQLVIDTSSGTGNGIQCTPKITPNHAANDRAANVTVTGSLTCRAEAYVPQEVQSTAADLFKSDAASQLGAGYALVGNLVVGTPQLQVANADGTTEFSVDTQGVWVFQFGDAQKHLLAQLIAGKTQTNTTALLLKQRGVRKVSIKTSGGWGTALPTSPDGIKMVVLSVPGL